MGRTRRKRARRKTRRARLLRAAWILFLGSACLLLAWLGLSWVRVGRLAEEAPRDWAFLERHREEARREGAPLPEPGWVPYRQVSPRLKQAILVAEDIDFFAHRGFAWEEIEIAVRETVSEGRRLRGASTLTQQLAKNLWLSPSRDPTRKLQEVALTWQLERRLEKRRILELYLNVVEFGPGVFGAGDASRHYFGRPASELSTEQAASLAASLPHSKWYPGCSSSAYARHRQRILGRMSRAEWILGQL